MEPEKEHNLLDARIEDLERGWDGLSANDFYADMTAADKKLAMDYKPIDNKLADFQKWLDKLLLDSNQDSN